MEPVILHILRDLTSFLLTHNQPAQNNVLDLSNSPIIICYLLLFALLIIGFLFYIRKAPNEAQKSPNWLSYVFFLISTQICVLFFFFSEFLVSSIFPSALGQLPTFNGIHSIFYLIPFLFILSSVILFFRLKKKFPERKRLHWMLSIFHLFLSITLFMFFFWIHGFYLNYIDEKFPQNPYESDYYIHDAEEDTLE